MKKYLSFVTLIIILLSSVIFAQEIIEKKQVIDFNELSSFSLKNNIEATSRGIELSSNGLKGLVQSENIQVPIQLPEPFLAVSYNLYFRSLEEENVYVYFRGSINGIEWQDWMEVGIDDHGEFIPGEFMGTLVFFEKDIKYIQYRIELNSTERIQSPDISAIRLVFISPGATPEEMLNEIKQVELKLNEMPDFIDMIEGTEDTYPRPPFVNRVGWGCPTPTGSPSNANWSPSTTLPTHLVVHHSAGGNISNDWAARVRSYWTLHVYTNNWADIGYNWLVDPNGVLYQGRQFAANGNENVVGAHFSGTNGGTMGVCVIGTYTSVSPTQNAIRTTVRILGYRASNRNINPRGISYHASSQKTLYNICGHRDGVGATECPGTNLYNQLPAIRNRVYALLNPPVVANVIADSISDTSVIFSGEVNPNDSQTEIFFQYGLTTQYGNITIPQILTGGTSFTAITAEIQNLTPSTIYNYRMIARNSDSIVVSDNNTFVTLGLPLQIEPVSPADDALIGSDSVLFVWNPAIPFADYYRFEIDTDSLFLNAIIDTTITDTLYLFNNLNNNTTYWWRIAAGNTYGLGDYSEKRSFSVSITNIGEELQIPSEFSLLQNYPNPFNPVTRINYSIAENSYVTLKVYDLLGREMAELVNSEKEAGVYSISFDASQLSSGIYFYILKAGTFIETKKMTLLR